MYANCTFSRTPAVRHSRGVLQNASSCRLLARQLMQRTPSAWVPSDLALALAIVGQGACRRHCGIRERYSKIIYRWGRQIMVKWGSVSSSESTRKWRREGPGDDSGHTWQGKQAGKEMGLKAITGADESLKHEGIVLEWRSMVWNKGHHGRW